MKTLLITGSSSGIGLALVKAYTEQGWRVFACARQTQALEKMAKSHSDLKVLGFDVTNQAQSEAVLSTIEQPIDLIILNAGTCEYVDNGQIDSALFRRVFETNFFGVLHCIEALQAKFNQATHLALMGSTASYLPFPRSEAYGASKAAIAYLANSLAVDLQSKGVTVSLISPGFVQTPLTDKNDFSMPMIISAEQAAKNIITALDKKKTEIHFPKKFSYLLKFLALLPMQIQRYLMEKLSRKNK